MSFSCDGLYHGEEDQISDRHIERMSEAKEKHKLHSTSASCSCFWGGNGTEGKERALHVFLEGHGPVDFIEDFHELVVDLRVGKVFLYSVLGSKEMLYARGLRDRLFM